MLKIISIYLRIPPYLLSVVVLAGILWLTLAPDPTGGAHLPLFPGADKIVHFIMFFGLSLCLSADFHFHVPRLKISNAVCAGAFISTLTGCIIEVLQDGMGLGRSFEPADMIADALGAVVGALIFRIVVKKS